MTELAIVVSTLSPFKCFADFCLKEPNKELFSRDHKILPKRELYFRYVSVSYSVLAFHSFVFSLVVPHSFLRSLFPSIVPLFLVHFVPFYLNPNYVSRRAIKISDRNFSPKMNLTSTKSFLTLTVFSSKISSKLKFSISLILKNFYFWGLFSKLPLAWLQKDPGSAEDEGTRIPCDSACMRFFTLRPMHRPPLSSKGTPSIIRKPVSSAGLTTSSPRLLTTPHSAFSH